MFRTRLAVTVCAIGVGVGGLAVWPAAGAPGVTASPWQLVAAGPSHTLAVDKDGLAWGWGTQASGRLGNRQVSGRTADPVRVGDLTGVAAVAAGASHSLAVTADGQVWAWGDNYSGQLGIAGVDYLAEPVPVAGLSDAVEVDAGDGFSMARTRAGDVYVWGTNWSGQLGNGSLEPSARPVLVEDLPGAVDIAAGESHAAALSASGEVWAWGANRSGQLGAGGGIDLATSPVRVPGLVPARAVEAGNRSTYTIDNAGRVWAWGDNSLGQLATGNAAVERSDVPVQVSGISNIAGIAATSHVAAISASGKLWTWGYNRVGQLGIGGILRSWTPRLVDVPPVVAAAVSTEHTVVLDAGGRLYAWGGNTDYQLGDQTSAHELNPTPITGLTGAVAVAAGESHSAALTASGTVYVWGLGDVGQLGNGGVEGSVTPVPVQGIGTVNSIASGAKHMLALTSGGLYAWGDNTWGQLGIGSAEMATSPTLIQGLPNDIVAIGAGPNHSAAVTQSGEVWAWGSNSDGQIGNNAGGAGQVVGLPYRVTGLPDQARAVAAGSSFTLALLKDGTVQVWGANVSGAFGDGTLSGSSVPVPGIAPGEGVTAVACGFSHALAITQSGKVLAWGSNDAGELGIQSSDSHSLTPVEVTGHSGKAVSGAGHSSMLIDADGKLFGWGDNAFGILGDGTVQARRAPVLIHSDPAVRAVALGSVHGIMAAGANGQVYTWGPNLYGELGYPAATWLPGHRTAIDLGEFPVADPDDDEDPGNGPGDGDPSGEPVGGDGPGGGNGNGLNPGDGSSGGGGRGGSGSDGDAGQGGGNSGAGNLDAGSAAPGVDGGGATARPDGPGGSARAATPGIARFAVSFTTVVIRPGESVKVPVAADGVRAGLKGKAAVTWTSSRPSTATLAGAKKSGKATWQVGKVKSVTVRGLKTGTSRIVLSSPGARKLVLRVRVVPASGARAIEAVALRVKGGTPASRSTLRVGETAGLKAWPVPLGAIRAKATWTSSNRSVAIVDAAGRVTATGPGKAVIACRVHGETTSLTIKVR